MEKKYIVYRIYSKKERPKLDERSSYYGWSESKSVIKAFLQQRSPDKYKVYKINKENIAPSMFDEVNDSYNMIDYIKLKSAATQEEFSLFMTMGEMKECEKSIQKMFIDKCSLSDIKGEGNYLEMFLNLDEYYADALFYIGFRPEEVDIMFPSSDYHDDYSNYVKIEEAIDDAYDGAYMHPEEVYDKNKFIPGLCAMDDVSKMLYYSLESFIKVLIDDL